MRAATCASSVVTRQRSSGCGHFFVGATPLVKMSGVEVCVVWHADHRCRRGGVPGLRHCVRCRSMVEVHRDAAGAGFDTGSDAAHEAGDGEVRTDTAVSWSSKFRLRWSPLIVWR